MAQPAIRIDEAPAAPAIDRAHLARMSLGDRSLEREVLELFERQTELLMARMRGAEETLPALAHTLKGSANGIGAFGVARAAEAAERAALGSAGERAAALDRLAAEIETARVAIGQMLRE